LLQAVPTDAGDAVNFPFLPLVLFELVVLKESNRSFCIRHRPSIDVLFESAADIYGEQVIAVILTGANKDDT
jgi:CheB methylesterase